MISHISHQYHLYISCIFLKPSHSPTNPHNDKKTAPFLFKPSHTPISYIVPYIPLVSFVYFLYFLEPYHSPTNPQNEKTGVFLLKLCHNPTKAYVVPYIPLVTLKYFFYFSEDIPQFHKPLVYNGKNDFFSGFNMKWYSVHFCNSNSIQDMMKNKIPT